MMHWSNYFDKVFLINLAHRVDRYMTSCDQLFKAGIDFELVRAIRATDGARGIYMTMISLFRECLEKKYKRILVFEDDFRFLVKPEDFMDDCIAQLPDTWRQLYLGVNLPKSHLVTWYSENLLSTTRALSLHAVAYSADVMEMILALPMQAPIDLQIANFIHPLGNIFCTYPLIASQWPGRSDISNRNEDNSIFIDRRYTQVIQHLKKQL